MILFAPIAGLSIGCAFPFVPWDVTLIDTVPEIPFVSPTVAVEGPLTVAGLMLIPVFTHDVAVVGK